ncbi:acyltransferase family protein [Mycobacterium sp. AMU20-3851]|uniref:acyltransferase family protein n=1 Tax=Mycobacterium sp. AMU20-3851 TaxID=3122055 RepID=UPI0037541655
MGTTGSSTINQPDTSAAVREKRLDIQGMRAVAVMLVVLFHAEIPGFGGGYVGVDVFFVISGFLISTHLLEALRNRGGVGFAAFYARRARRLLPAAFLVIVATVLAARLLVSPIQFEHVLKDAVAATFYVPNLWFAHNATDYLAEKTPSLFLHYWSLGVEEQFYLLWPLLLALLFRFFKARWTMAIAMSAIVVLSFAVCLHFTSTAQPAAFFMLPARVWEFGLGALVALALLDRRSLFAPRVAAVLGWVGLIAVLGAGMLFSVKTVYPGSAVAIPVLGAALLIAAGTAPGGPAAVLSVRPATWIGDISYSLYLVHWPVLMLPVAAGAYMEQLPMWARIALALACLPLAWLLYTYVEVPGQRLEWLRAARPRRTFGVAAGAMATIVAITVAAGLLLHPKLDTGKPAPAIALAASPVGTDFVPSNLVPTLADVDEDKPVLYDNGCHREMGDASPADCVVGTNPAAPRVVLFGDSHAAQWFPALQPLAQRGAVRLESHTKSGCPAAPTPQLPYASCPAWVEAVAAKLSADPPALILLGNFGKRYLEDEPNPAELWQQALIATIDRLPVQSRIVVLADTPSIGVTPSICLARFSEDADHCALQRATALDEELRTVERAVAARFDNVSYVDFTELICNDAECPSIIGNTLVYRDGSHITTEFARVLSGAVSSAVQSYLPLTAEPSGRREPPQDILTVVKVPSRR